MKEYPPGYLTKQDFERLYAQFFPFGDAGPFSQMMFNMFDVNRNGKLEFYEYTLALSITTRGKFMEKVKCMSQFSYSLTLYIGFSLFISLCH
jgi:neuronal calcium sensor 1